MGVSIRKFQFEDISKKIEWINNPENHRFLHYEIPLEYEKTVNWFRNIENRTDRYDAVIEFDGVPVGLIGLLSMNDKLRKAEFYISMGEISFKGKGIAFKASKLLLNYAFSKLNLNKVYLYTEKENHIAQKLFKKLGFSIEKASSEDAVSAARYVDRLTYGITKKDFLSTSYPTPICYLDNLSGNHLYIKREDMIPYSFGGNKARKAMLFFREIDEGDYDCVVTYGSSHSNHCRVVANMCAQRKMQCHIISPEEVSDKTYNSVIMELFKAQITYAPVNEVHDTIENKIAELKKLGKKPYFIYGGGHGNLGTQAYAECYDEILACEKENHLFFDYIFFASGTGTTQAGLVCGQLIHGDSRKIVGISIARKNPRGRDVVVDSVREYLSAKDIPIAAEDIEKAVIFDDTYTGGGYAEAEQAVCDTIVDVMRDYGIPLDETYTGKAYYGMKEYLLREKITDSNILFIHTGGTPLFFDFLKGKDA